MANSPDFMGLPTEVRQNIFEFLLVQHDVYREKDWCVDRRPTITYGSVGILEYTPPGPVGTWKRSSYMVQPGDCHKRRQRRTYTMDAKFGLSNFQVCRQVYEEASLIFYSKNFFFIDNLRTLKPFLQDRPQRAKALIHSISLRYPATVPWTDLRPLDDSGGSLFVPEAEVESIFLWLAEEKKLMPNLKYLDLRLQNANINYDHNSKQFYPLKPRDVNFRGSQNKLLSSLAAIVPVSGNITFSLFNWHRMHIPTPDRFHGLREPIPDALQELIQQPDLKPSESRLFSFRPEIGLTHWNDE